MRNLIAASISKNLFYILFLGIAVRSQLLHLADVLRGLFSLLLLLLPAIFVEAEIASASCAIRASLNFTENTLRSQSFVLILAVASLLLLKA